MKAPIILIALAALVGCASSPITVVSQTPASIEIVCTSMWYGCPSPQAVADAAQQHCKQFGQNAAEQQLMTSQSGDRRVTYRCVP